MVEAVVVAEPDMVEHETANPVVLASREDVALPEEKPEPTRLPASSKRKQREVPTLDHERIEMPPEAMVPGFATIPTSAAGVEVAGVEGGGVEPTGGTRGSVGVDCGEGEVCADCVHGTGCVG